MWEGGGHRSILQIVIGLCIDEKVVNHCCRVLCFVPVLRWCVCSVRCYVRKKALLHCLCNYREKLYGPIYEVPMFMSLLGLGIGTMLAHFHM